MAKKIKIGKLEERILKLLSNEGRPFKTSEIAKRLKTDTKSIRISARRLESKRYLTKYKEKNSLHWTLVKKTSVKKTSVKKKEGVKKERNDVIININKDDNRSDALQKLIQELDYEEVEVNPNNVVVKGILRKDIEALVNMEVNLGLKLHHKTGKLEKLSDKGGIWRISKVIDTPKPTNIKEKAPKGYAPITNVRNFEAINKYTAEQLKKGYRVIYVEVEKTKQVGATKRKYIQYELYKRKIPVRKKK